MVSWRKRSKVCQSQTHCQLGLAGFDQYLWHTDELPEQYWTVYEESRNPFSCPEGTRRNYKTQQQEVGGQSLFSTCWGISSVDTVTLWHCDCDTEKLSLLWNTISDCFPVPSQAEQPHCHCRYLLLCQCVSKRKPFHFRELVQSVTQRG